MIMNDKFEKATFASGCFWCGEAIFEELEGVESAESGYAGGEKDDPTYEEVSTGKTGHAEAVQLTFDPGRISYNDLLKVFWATHDPTQLDRQGPDVGHQYRSMIFYHNEDQKKLAEESKKHLEESGEFKKPIVTEIVALEKFYPAENYHQDFYSHNPDAPYCQAVINPKLEKFKKHFKGKLKK